MGERDGVATNTRVGVDRRREWREQVVKRKEKRNDVLYEICFFFQAEDGIRGVERSRGHGDVYRRQGDA